MWKVCDFQFLVVILLTHSLANAFYVNDQLEKDEIIEAVNNAKTTWTVRVQIYQNRYHKLYLIHTILCQ